MGTRSRGRSANWFLVFLPRCDDGGGRSCRAEAIGPVDASATRGTGSESLGRGPAPRLLRADETGDGVLLIERVIPGQPLSNAEDDLIRGVTRLVSSLHGAPASEEASRLLPPLAAVVGALTPLPEPRQQLAPRRSIDARAAPRENAPPRSKAVVSSERRCDLAAWRQQLLSEAARSRGAVRASMLRLRSEPLPGSGSGDQSLDHGCQRREKP